MSLERFTLGYQLGLAAAFLHARRDFARLKRAAPLQIQNTVERKVLAHRVRSARRAAAQASHAHCFRRGYLEGMMVFRPRLAHRWGSIAHPSAVSVRIGHQGKMQK